MLTKTNSTKREAPYSTTHHYITPDQKRIYNEALAVIRIAGGSPLRYVDNVVVIDTDAKAENLTIKLAAMDCLIVFRATATGGMIERHRPGKWQDYISGLYRDTREIARRTIEEIAELDALRFEPVDDSEVFAGVTFDRPELAEVA